MDPGHHQLKNSFTRGVEDCDSGVLRNYQLHIPSFCRPELGESLLKDNLPVVPMTSKQAKLNLSRRIKALPRLSEKQLRARIKKEEIEKKQSDKLEQEARKRRLLSQARKERQKAKGEKSGRERLPEGQRSLDAFGFSSERVSKTS